MRAFGTFKNIFFLVIPMIMGWDAYSIHNRENAIAKYVYFAIAFIEVIEISAYLTCCGKCFFLNNFHLDND